MYGITFGNKHSVNDWGLILTEVQRSAPEPKRYTVEVPGADGLIDVTQALTERMRYQNRTLRYTFRWKAENMDFAAKIAEVEGYLHGQTMTVEEDMTPGYYWKGFCTVEELQPKGQVGALAVNVSAYPYRMKATETVKTITGNGSVDCTNDRLPVCPYIENTAEAEITFGSRTFTLSPSGDNPHQIADLVFSQGSNLISVESSGTTKFTYREGTL